ncbi:MAG: ABC-F family ATP-binding cassette domain-containing protein [Bacteriovoracaceae bacterium]
MLQLTNLSKSYGTREIFDQVTLQMGPGERLGLVGRNGYGKSTLFKMILGEEAYDSGSLSFPKNYRLGHLAQHLRFTKPTILEEASLGLLPEEQELTYKVEAILFGLGFTKADMSRAPSEFSGGYQVRLNLAKVLVNNPNLLLLDEPTNYLDIISIRWLTGFLRQWKNELIIISHDRDFMDRVTTHTAMIHRNKIKKIPGDTQKVFEQIMLEEEIYEKTRQNDQKKRAEVEEFVNRFRAQANKASMVQSRVKMLEKMPEQEKLAKIQSLGFSFHYSPTQAKVILEAENLNFGYDENKPLIKNLSITVKHGEKIAIIGKNGKGKSTLLNLLAQNFKANSGVMKNHASMKDGFFGQTNIERLVADSTVEEEIASVDRNLTKTQIRGICGSMMFSSDDATKKISILSGGEKSRVLLGKILAKEANVLFLDEPTNHLDMDSISALTESLALFPGTVFIVTHSEMILKELPTRFIVFQNDEQLVFDGSYDDFLQKVGWEEEKTGQERKSGLSRKEAQHQRALIIKERSSVVNPLKSQVDKIEFDITSLEESIHSSNEAILAATEKGESQKIGPLSQTIKEAERKIDELFLELEEKSLKLSEATLRFEKALQDLE